MADEKLSRKEKKEQKKKEKEEKKKAKKKAKGGADADETTEDEEESGGIGTVIVVGILILLVWLAILAIVIRMDVGGFGSEIAYPRLKNIPVVNKILPEVDEEELPTEDGGYSFKTMDEAIARIQELEQQLAAAQSSGDDASRVAELEALVAELQPYKDDVDAFEAEKQKFYEEVVFSDKAPDIEEYKAYYESIDPDNAATVYRQVVEQLEESQQIKDYAAAYSSMDPKSAATIFDSMTNNFSLVGRILWTMDAESRGKILEEMNADNAAALTEMMEPK